MKTYLAAAILFFPLLTSGQSITGKWQLVKQSTCIDDELSPSSPEEEELVNDMRSRNQQTPQVITFKDNNTAEENTKIISRRKNYNSRNMLYRFNGETLYILDKPSRTIVEGFAVERITADSLIISNVARACETRIFIKIR